MKWLDFVQKPCILQHFFRRNNSGIYSYNIFAATSTKIVHNTGICAAQVFSCESLENNVFLRCFFDMGIEMHRR